MSPKSSSLCFLVILAITSVHAKLAGNEDYASTRKLARRLSKRASSGAVSTLGGVSFAAGDDFTGEDPTIYYSPLNSKTYELDLTGGSFGSHDAGAYKPVTVISGTTGFDCSALSSAIDTFQANDDVFDPKIFLQGLILQSVSKADLSSCLSTYETSLVAYEASSAPSSSDGSVSVASYSSSTIPQGPYLASISGNRAYLTPVYRVYKDEYQAYTSPAIPDASGYSFVAETAQFPGMSTQSIPVPSKIYTLNTTTKEKPLSGLRFAVKDLYDVQGLKTGGGNRAFWSLYAPATANSLAVQRLLDMGAHITGKVKTSQFANGESPTADWVDQISPFNPRGDSYQDPSTSSAGSGASIAAYGWLDFTIGSDSGGSVRDPAANQGVYGIRPTHGAINLTGVLPLASVLDTAGYLTRDAYTFQKVGKAWYGDAFKEYTSFPKKLYVPSNYFPITTTVGNPEAQPIYTKFIKQLSSFLGGVTQTNASLQGIWNDTLRSSHDDLDLYSYVNLTYGTLIGYYQSENLGQPFFADYAAIHDGRTPFVDPTVETRWSYGQARGESAYEEAINQKTTFLNFVDKHVLKPDANTCSDSLFLYPINSGTTSYRNQFMDAPKAPMGFFSETISPLAETPEIVIPLGQVPYNSTVSNHVEYLPVSVAIIAARGCDYMLLNLAADLQGAGIIKPSLPGNMTYAL